MNASILHLGVLIILLPCFSVSFSNPVLQLNSMEKQTEKNFTDKCKHTVIQIKHFHVQILCRNTLRKSPFFPKMHCCTEGDFLTNTRREIKQNIKTGSLKIYNLENPTESK